MTAPNAPREPLKKEPWQTPVRLSRQTIGAQIWRLRLKLLTLVLVVLTVLTASPARAQVGSSGPCYGGCNPASRHPFEGFWITDPSGSRSLWFPGGDVGAAFAADMANYNLAHAYPNCFFNYTVTQASPVGFAPLDETGGSWRWVYAIRTYVNKHLPGCYAPVESFTRKETISGVCHDTLNINHAKSGTDDACYCPVGLDWSASRKACLKTIDRLHFGTPDLACKASNPSIGNPIYPLTGSKTQSESLGFSIGREDVALIFDSLPRVAYAAGSSLSNGSPAFFLPPPIALPGLWSSSVHKSLFVKAPQSVQAYRGAGRWVSFTGTGSSYVTDPTVGDRLVANGTGWRYFDHAASAMESYDGAGRLLSTRYSKGSGLTYTYSTVSTPQALAAAPGLLIGVTDEHSRSVSLSYDSGNRLSKVTTPIGRTIALTYDANNNLSQLVWSDNTLRTFLYERTDLPWALTGVVGEAGARNSVFSYNPQGLAVGTSRLAGAGVSVDAFGVSYGPAAPAWSVIETADLSNLSPPTLWRDHYFTAAPSLTLSTPTGSMATMGGISVMGSPRLTSQSQAAGSGCAASVSNQSYDANGNLSSREDFNGNRVCYANDLTRNLETARVEGLAAGAACTATTPGTAVPAGARKTSTQWHPNWSLRTRTAEPGRTTTFVYNGQPDPFAGATLASCAPSGAVLPDGTPIAVLCRQVEHTNN